ncbi:S9 family peptidase [Flavobacterium sp. 5]|uniref:alpha/beta hydrolase family protein n=1 Tax=Flavobacterium sp. 5 TaxID=2035199 RepID=UPI000C2C580A|nr:prolyl oligopeptidase family serine peptidase [Flavobacterium sp. 5]
MGKSLYADKEGYLRNSPILHAENIKTPLLLWSGKKDRIVPIHKSEAFYLALQRLRLQNIFLAYPDEGHSISNTENQVDLTNRVQQWFDYFLKDKTDEEWISKGTTFD